jgi:CheY-like chemotaxis protein
MAKILIAEDNVTNRKLFREVLEARGYTVAEACDGQRPCG